MSYKKVVVLSPEEYENLQHQPRSLPSQDRLLVDLEQQLLEILDSSRNSTAEERLALFRSKLSQLLQQQRNLVTAAATTSALPPPLPPSSQEEEKQLLPAYGDEQAPHIARPPASPLPPPAAVALSPPKATLSLSETAPSMLTQSAQTPSLSTAATPSLSSSTELLATPPAGGRGEGEGEEGDGGEGEEAQNNWIFVSPPGVMVPVEKRSRLPATERNQQAAARMRGWFETMETAGNIHAIGSDLIQLGPNPRTLSRRELEQLISAACMAKNAPVIADALRTPFIAFLQANNYPLTDIINSKYYYRSRSIPARPAFRPQLWTRDSYRE